MKKIVLILVFLSASFILLNCEADDTMTPSNDDDIVIEYDWQMVVNSVNAIKSLDSVYVTAIVMGETIETPLFSSEGTKNHTFGLVEKEDRVVLKTTDYSTFWGNREEWNLSWEKDADSLKIEGSSSMLALCGGHEWGPGFAKFSFKGALISGSEEVPKYAGIYLWTESTYNFECIRVSGEMEVDKIR